MTVSEVADIKRQIAAEYMAAKWGLSGLAYGIPRHDFISARLEKMGEGQRQLAALIGEEQAGTLVADTLVTLPEKPERHALPDLLTYIRGDTEETAHLIDYLRELWETIDMLKREFGEEGAQKIIHAPGISFSELPVS